MTTHKTSLICNRFAGIRRINSQFSSEMISCSDCQNVELYNTGVNSGVGIRTAKGNQSLYDDFSEGETIINLFSSFQNGIEYCFVHTETEEEGTIYTYNNGVLTEKTTLNNVTGKSCGTDFSQGWDDLFMFTNGTDIVKIQLGASPECTDLTLTGTESESITGMGFKVFNSRLWIFKDNRLWYSYKGDCTDFSTTDPSLTTSAGYIEFPKKITAIYPYLGSLAVFHQDSSCLVTVSSEDSFSVSEESPGGCAGYDALVFHGTDLYFYDDTKKGVFSFQQVVNGDKTLGDNIALDVQNELLNIDNTKFDNIKALSVVLSDRNEVWLLVPQKNETNSTILIFDYIHKEWVKRVEQSINCIRIVFNSLFSGGEKLYEEYVGNSFDEEFIPCFYNATPINLGVDNTLKILYFPPRITLDTSFYNDFWVKYIKNYDYLKKVKNKRVKTKTLKKVLYYNTGQCWNDGYYYMPSNCSAIAKLPSATFKTLEMRFYTQAEKQDFCIKNIEFSKIKVKQI